MNEPSQSKNNFKVSALFYENVGVCWQVTLLWFFAVHFDNTNIYIILITVWSEETGESIFQKE